MKKHLLLSIASFLLLNSAGFAQKERVFIYPAIPPPSLELPPPKDTTLIKSGKSYRPTSRTAGVTQISERNFHIRKDIFLKSLKDPDVLNSAYAVPYFLNNELSGYRLQSIEPGSRLFSFGFRPNDVFLKANKQPLNSPTNVKNFFKEAPGLNSLVITVLRNGQEVSLNYKISK